VKRTSDFAEGRNKARTKGYTGTLRLHWLTADTIKLAMVTSMAAAAMEKSAWARMVVAGETPRRRECPCFTDVRRYR
jgi:hypothetical protein